MSSVRTNEITQCPQKCGQSVGTRPNRGLSRKRKRPRLPRDYADLKQRATTTDWWRWGESNPRPLLWSCAFYGCSQLSRFLSPGTCLWHLLRRAQYQLESLCALMLNAEASLLADARIRVEDNSRSDGLFKWRRGTYAARAKSALAETVRLLLALIVLHGSFTR